MLSNALKLALQQIRRNLMRSFLTTLGIIIGVAAVITMVTMGNGATAQVTQQVSSLGSNLMMVNRGQGFGPGRDRVSGPGFDLDDIDAIRAELAGIKAIAPVSIGIAGGMDKVEPLLGALRGEYINVLITDEATVRQLVALVDRDTEEVA